MDNQLKRIVERYDFDTGTWVRLNNFMELTNGCAFHVQDSDQREPSIMYLAVSDAFLNSEGIATIEVTEFQEDLYLKPEDAKFKLIKE